MYIMKATYVPTTGGAIVNARDQARQGKGFLLPLPTCLCMQEPDIRTASLSPSFWHLVLFVSLNTAAKAQKSPCLLLPKL